MCYKLNYLLNSVQALSLSARESMTEEQAKAVNNQEVGAPEAVSQDQDTQQGSSTEPKQGSKEFNFRRLELEKKDLELRLQRQEQTNQEMLTALKGLNQTKQPPEEVLPDLSPDDIPEWKHVQKYVDRVAGQKAQELLAKRDRDSLPEQARRKYSDFDEVVTAERVQKFEKENPDLAKAFSLANDPFTAVYSYFKTINQPRKVDPIAMEEAEKILENDKKPNSINAIGKQGVLKNANAFQKKSKEQLYKDMMEAASRVG